MIPSEMKRVEVWSGRLRLAHWLLALTTLVLMATGWLSLQSLHDRLPMLMSIHAVAGYGLVAALALRVYLLFFGQGPEHWRDLIPRGPQFKAVGEMLLFYITLGRRSLPAYYAHNPLWAPIHLLLFAVLVMLAASGLVLALADASALAYYEASPWAFGYTLPELHQAGLPLVVGYAAAHILAVFVHDWRSGGSEISAIIGGYKLFIVRRAADTLPDNVRPISIERLRGGPGRGGRP
jgi:Ni/Fe-hydrogenase 1 B-type cytochrome subunit